MPRKRADTDPTPLYPIFKDRPLFLIFESFLSELGTKDFRKITVPDHAEVLLEAFKEISGKTSPDSFKKRENLFKAVLASNREVRQKYNKLIIKKMLDLLIQVCEDQREYKAKLQFLIMLSGFPHPKSFLQKLEFIHDILEAKFVSMSEFLLIISNMKLKEDYHSPLPYNQTTQTEISNVIQKIGELLKQHNELNFETPAGLFINNQAQLTQAEKEEYDLLNQFLNHYSFLLPKEIIELPLFTQPLLNRSTTTFTTVLQNSPELRKRAVSLPVKPMLPEM